jgi:hypothetical protein
MPPAKARRPRTKSEPRPAQPPPPSLGERLDAALRDLLAEERDPAARWFLAGLLRGDERGK